MEQQVDGRGSFSKKVANRRMAQILATLPPFVLSTRAHMRKSWRNEITSFNCESRLQAGWREKKKPKVHPAPDSFE